MSIRTPVIVALLAGFAATAVANAPAPTPHIAPYDATYESKVRLVMFYHCRACAVENYQVLER